MTVTNSHIKKWGSYSDRKNSYDDTKDIEIFCDIVADNKSLQEYLVSFLSKKPVNLTSHPNGAYGVDVGIVSSDDELLGTIDIERWSLWNEDWPSFYRCIHFFGRKEKFLNEYEVPFFMAFMNYDRTKVLMISEQDIRKYPTIDKYFKHKRVTDRVKELPMSSGHLFGKNITLRERNLFQ